MQSKCTAQLVAALGHLKELGTSILNLPPLASWTGQQDLLLLHPKTSKLRAISGCQDAKMEAKTIMYSVYLDLSLRKLFDFEE